MITTKCEDCVFLEDKICSQGITTFQNKENTYTNNYCTTKRNNDWFSNNKNEDIEHLIRQENNTVSVVCNLYDLKSEKEFFDLFSGINNKKINEYLFLVNQTKIAPKIFNFLHYRDDINKWHIKILSSDILIDRAFNEASTSVSSNNILFIKDYKNIKIDNFIKNVNKYLCVTDNANYLCNKHAFMELSGNIGINWLEKIKQIEGWEKSCLVLHQ